MRGIFRYAHKDQPIPDGARFVLCGGHHGRNGYGMIIREEAQAQVLIAVYDDGLLVTVDGVSTFRPMTSKQMLWLAQDLIKAGAKDERADGRS